jgi:hypothetical protein
MNHFSFSFILNPKCIAFLFLFFLLSGKVSAQAKFGDNRTTIQPGSLMELESTNKGFLNIRLNTTQMLAVPVSPVSRGMMVYNIDSACLCVYNGTAWKNMCNTGKGAKQFKVNYIANLGDATFTTPSIIDDTQNVQIFRNGVQVNFTATVGTNLITLESAAICKQDDEIKIVQLVNP